MHEIENEDIIQYDKFDQKIILHSSEMDMLLLGRVVSQNMFLFKDGSHIQL